MSRKHLPARVKAFVNFMLERLRSNPDLTSDPQALLAPFAGIAKKASAVVPSSARKNTLTDHFPVRT
jgi:hypothetical protein